MTAADLTGLKMTGARLKFNRLLDVKLRHADLRCTQFEKNFSCQALMKELVEPGHLGCQLDGAIVGGRQFPWLGGPKPMFWNTQAA